jgi:hypothetical protein
MNFLSSADELNLNEQIENIYEQKQLSYIKLDIEFTFGGDQSKIDIDIFKYLNACLFYYN